jgi:hypothetical protein
MAKREAVVEGAEIHDGASLRQWLKRNPAAAPIIAVRCALRVLPVFAGRLPATLNIQVFRVTFVVWTSQRLGWYNKELIRAAAAAVAAAAAAADADAATDAYAAAAAAAATDAYAAAAAAATTTDAAAYAADAAAAAAYAAATIGDLWESVAADAKFVETDQGLKWQRLWLNDVSGGARKRLNLPDWARTAFDSFKRSDGARDAEFAHWIRWYEGVLAGRREGYFDSQFKFQSERDLFIRVAEQPDSFWKQEPAKVNADIRRLIDEAKAAKAPEAAPDPTDGEQDATLLVQRPSSHRFAWHEQQLEATIVTERPFDPVLAESIIAELREKAAEALRALNGNDADEIVARATERLSETLKSNVEELAEGVLLMRANTLAAHSRAYSDPKTERDRAIRAVLDDLSSSVESLVDCYPGIRTINANRLALNMQAEDAGSVEASIEAISDLAKASGVPSRFAAAALDMGRDEVSDLDEKIERETNPARVADYIRTRGDLVAARLLNMTNAVSAVLQKAGTELGGIAGDTWKEIRKTLPKAVANGVAKGTEAAVKTTIEKAPAVGLAYLIVGPWGAVAALVPSLRRHARKAEEIKDRVEKEIDEA